MINIITVEFDSVRGPAKVVRNLVKGLDEIRYPYVVNKEINATKRCYIPNRRTALFQLHKARSHVILGPNLYVLPKEIPRFVKLGKTIYLMPSEWAIRLWKVCGFNGTCLRCWPTGIDTSEFYPAKKNNRKVTVYHKKRSAKELRYLEDTLRQMSVPYRVITYGNYTEAEYKEILNRTSFLIWHGCHESQGIALQEALSCDISVLIFDVASLSEESPSHHKWSPKVRDIEVTSAPYFDQRCGMKTKDIYSARSSIEHMIDNLKSFHPRDFILDTLSLARQARALIEMYEHFGLRVAEGYDEGLVSQKAFSDGMLGRTMHVLTRLEYKLWNRSL